MLPQLDQLLSYTRTRVSPQDIKDFCPGDPGYPRYVKMWTQIWETGKVPNKPEFDISEVVGLTTWVREDEYSDYPPSFLHFKRFIASVALYQLHLGVTPESVQHIVYLTRNLIIDTTEAEHIKLLLGILPCTREIFIDEPWETDCPFITLTLLALSQKLSDWDLSEKYATQLILDDSHVRTGEGGAYVESDHFCLGLTNQDLLHKEWIAIVKALKNPTNHQDTQLVIDSILNH